MNKQTKAHARVQITVEVEAGNGWGEECTVGQIYRQAAESAKSSLITAIHAGGKSFKLVGEPKVIGILTEEA